MTQRRKPHVERLKHVDEFAEREEVAGIRATQDNALQQMSWIGCSSKEGPKVVSDGFSGDQGLDKVVSRRNLRDVRARETCASEDWGVWTYKDGQGVHVRQSA